MTRCIYCDVFFPTNSGYERHMSRQTGCISQAKMHETISSLQKRVNDLLKDQKYQQSNKCTKVEIAQLYETVRDKDNMIMTVKQEIWDLKQKLKEYENVQKDQEAIIQALQKEQETHRNWDEIHIICPKLSSRTKATIKKIIAPCICFEDVENAILGMYQDEFEIKSMTREKKKLTIEILWKRSECQICFTNPVIKSTLCKNCKFSYTCSNCEIKQKERYGKCAFCNTSYM